MPTTLSFDELQSIANTLATGFQILLDRVDEQKEVEDSLRSYLKQAVQKYELLDRSSDSSSGDISGWHNEIFNQLSDAAPADAVLTPQTSNEKIDQAQTALRRWKAGTMSPTVPVRKCPISHKTIDQEDLEHDFTTPGRIGDLGCPFAKMSSDASAICGPDPIAEEFHGEKASARSKSSGQGGSRCPIRFLDKHSPEEVAQYFENHKHEIPRSHQICVKRYQQNEESIRELDAKYGNLVSMIQGLGNKHKQYLPQNEKVSDGPERESAEAVGQWAERVSHHSLQIEEPTRVPHFERPLRDIRVGESPSRPWGISVPVGKSPAASASPSEMEVRHSAKPPSTAPAPVQVSGPIDDSPDKLPQQSRQEQKHSNLQPQIVFNGPVFFGYSAEQAALFLQNLNLGSNVTR